MKNAWILLALASSSCFTDPRPGPPVTRYATHRLSLRGSEAFLDYGASFTFKSCNDATCFGDLESKPVSVLRSDLLDVPPPRGPKFVFAVPGIDEATSYSIDAYTPKGFEVHLVGIDRWVSVDSLRDRRETPAEKSARLKAAKEEEEERAKRTREQLAEQEQEARQAAKRDRANAQKQFLEDEADRRRFAVQLRTNYLASGSDVKVRVNGKHGDSLTLQYPLINDVWVYQFQHNDEVISTLRAKGFRSLTLSNGFEYAMRITF